MLANVWRRLYVFALHFLPQGALTFGCCCITLLPRWLPFGFAHFCLHFFHACTSRIDGLQIKPSGWSCSLGVYDLTACLHVQQSILDRNEPLHEEVRAYVSQFETTQISIIAFGPMHGIRLARIHSQLC